MPGDFVVYYKTAPKRCGFCGRTGCVQIAYEPETWKPIAVCERCGERNAPVVEPR